MSSPVPVRPEDSASAVGSGAASTTGANFGVGESSAKKRRREEKYASQLAEDTERDNLAELNSLVKGKLNLQALLLRQLRKGTLEKNLLGRKSGGAEVKLISPGNNKYDMLTVDNWSFIYHAIDSDRFPTDSLKKVPKASLCLGAAFFGAIQPKSSIWSRKLYLTARFLVKRNLEFGERVKRIVWTRAEDGEVLDIDWSQTHGVYRELLNEVDGANKTFIQHFDKKITVDVTNDFPTPLKFVNNWSDSDCEVFTKWGTQRVVDVFRAAGYAQGDGPNKIPRPFFAKHITVELNDEDRDSLDEYEEVTQGASRTSAEPGSAAASGSPDVGLAALAPAGDGNAVAPDPAFG